jgi:hypothetical protein
MKRPPPRKWLPRQSGRGASIVWKTSAANFAQQEPSYKWGIGSRSGGCPCGPQHVRAGAEHHQRSARGRASGRFTPPDPRACFDARISRTNPQLSRLSAASLTSVFLKLPAIHTTQLSTAASAHFPGKSREPRCPTSCTTATAPSTRTRPHHAILHSSSNPAHSPRSFRRSDKSVRERSLGILASGVSGRARESSAAGTAPANSHPGAFRTPRSGPRSAFAIGTSAAAKRAGRPSRPGFPCSLRRPFIECHSS